MKNGYIAMVLLGALYASGANANESGARIELRSGIASAAGTTEATLGAALGYDLDVGSEVFVGAEVTADTNTSFESPVYGANARLGAKVGDSSKLYATVGYAWSDASIWYWSPVLPGGYVSNVTVDDTMVGAGFEQDIGEKSYVRIQYSRYLDSEANYGLIGVGLRF